MTGKRRRRLKPARRYQRCARHAARRGFGCLLWTLIPFAALAVCLIGVFS